MVEGYVSLAVGSDFTPQGPDFVPQTSVDHILDTSSPSSLVAGLMHSGEDEATAVKVLEREALRRVVEIHHVKLLDEGSHRELVPRLNTWLRGENWVVVQHSHFLENCRLVLRELAEVCILSVHV